MKTAKWIAFVLTIISGLLCLLNYVPLWIYNNFFAGNHSARTVTDAGTVGIIGGADGPTAIFLTSSDPYQRFIYPSIFLVSLISWLLIRSKIKKMQ